MQTGNSNTTLIVNFDVKTDPNTDLILTQARETQAASQLPADVNNYGITVRKSVTAPLMLVCLVLAAWNLRRQLSGELRVHQYHRSITPHRASATFRYLARANTRCVCG